MEPLGPLGQIWIRFCWVHMSSNPTINTIKAQLCTEESNLNSGGLRWLSSTFRSVASYICFYPSIQHVCVECWQLEHKSETMKFVSNSSGNLNYNKARKEENGKRKCCLPVSPCCLHSLEYNTPTEDITACQEKQHIFLFPAKYLIFRFWTFFSVWMRQPFEN